MPGATLRRGTSSCVERLESRALLAHVGLDLNFGDAGYAPIDASLLVAPLPGGKVLAVGALGAVRLNPDGALDEVFVDRGTKSDVTRFANMAVVAGQQLFIAGTTRDGTPEQPGSETGLFVRKLNLKTGSPGSGFGANGVVMFQPVPAAAGALESFQPTSIMPTADGGVIISVFESIRVGDQPYASTEAIILHKLDAAGDLDKSFGHNGVVTATLIQEYDYLAVAQLVACPDGSFILLAGLENHPTLQRFKADGSPDTTFGVDGVVSLDDIGIDFINLTFGKLTVQPDGKLLIPMSSTDISYQHSARLLARLNVDGSRDSSFDGSRDSTFDGDGMMTLGRAESPYPTDVALDSAGRIYGVARDIELFRLTSAGAFDPSFDDDGLTTIPQALTGGEPTFGSGNLAIDASGNILIAGGAGVSRFADAKPRVTLDSHGVVRIDGTPASDTITTSLAGDTLTVTFNGQNSAFAAGDVVGFLVTGSAGDDVVDLAAAPFAAATINAGEGDDSILTGDARDEIYCGDGKDTVHAGGGKDLILAGDGDDSIWGDAGDDHVFGEYGNDSISGGDGNDRLYGGHTYLLVNDEYSDTYDGEDSLSGNAGNDRVNGQFGNDRVAGNGGRDRLFGGDGGDRLYGGANADWLYGDSGPDQLFGDGGNDRLYGDDASVQFGYVDTLHGNAGDDLLVSSDDAADQSFGDGGHDTSIADAGDILSSIEART